MSIIRAGSQQTASVLVQNKHKNYQELQMTSRLLLILSARISAPRGETTGKERTRSSHSNNIPKHSTINTVHANTKANITGLLHKIVTRARLTQENKPFCMFLLGAKGKGKPVLFVSKKICLQRANADSYSTSIWILSKDRYPLKWVCAYVRWSCPVLVVKWGAR